ncbi:hypothetical protein [Phreatobacter stygius]|uniref:Uncharacterized protein n=1 Tax=Phreatobacter stygius TaxID=1940610 RepID=A0A4D7AV57_9HYPH|nr:hypothetical protein [Phreatobacter stygius]QCI63611.1 hypothetical protein E8M01_04775 [Phreatobacter stygius]
MSALPRLALGFVAGALSILIFDQATSFALNQLGLAQIPVYSLRPASPLGIPQIANQCLWGGLWGILFVILWDRSSFQASGHALAIVFGIFAGALVWGATSLAFGDFRAIAVGVLFGALIAGLIALFGAGVLFGLLFGVMGPAMVNWVVLPVVRGQALFGGSGRIAVTAVIGAMFGLGMAVLLSLTARLAGGGRG